MLAACLAAVLVLGACSDGSTNAPAATLPPSATSSTESTPDLVLTMVYVGDAVFRAELALTRDERALGLGNRDTLEPSAGMLFVFPQPRRATFWMQNMRFPLDFVWISPDRRVTQVDENIPPPSDDGVELPLYTSELDVQYMLEINAGLASELGISPGDAVTFVPEVDTTRAE